MRRLQKVQLWGGPLDGMRYSISTVNGKLPSSVFVNVPTQVPQPFALDGGAPYPVTAVNPSVVEYVLAPEPQYALEPIYRFRQR